MDLETHLNNVFTKGARDIYNRLAGKTWTYAIDDSFDLNSKGIKAKGKCIVNSVTYDSDLDCNIYSITDIDTNQNYVVNQFAIDLQ